MSFRQRMWRGHIGGGAGAWRQVSLHCSPPGSLQVGGELAAVRGIRDSPRGEDVRRPTVRPRPGVRMQAIHHFLAVPFLSSPSLRREFIESAPAAPANWPKRNPAIPDSSATRSRPVRESSGLCSSMIPSNNECGGAVDARICPALRCGPSSRGMSIGGQQVTSAARRLGSGREGGIADLDLAHGVRCGRWVVDDIEALGLQPLQVVRMLESGRWQMFRNHSPQLLH